MTDRDEISKNLEDLPLKAVAAIGVRAAMRALPMLASRKEGEQVAFALWPAYRKKQLALTSFRSHQVAVFINSSSQSSATQIASTILDGAAHEVRMVDFGSGAAADASIFAQVSTRDSAAAVGLHEKRVFDAAATAVQFASYVHAASHLNFSADIASAKDDADAHALSMRPLWQHGLPDQIFGLWNQLCKDLQSLNAGFDVWIDWYRDRLDGRPLDLDLERKWALLSDDTLAKSPSEINAYLKSLRDEHFRAPNSRVTIPKSQEPGLQFAPQEDGRIDLTPSGIAPSDDVAEILAIRRVIVEAIDDLTVLLDGSNAYQSIVTVAQRYKSSISASELSVDLLYAYGVRLENSRSRLEREIESGDFPDLAVPAGEALDSVIALHGPVVYSTARGKVLVERAREFNADGLNIAAYKPAAQQVAAAIDKAEAAVTELARETIKRASEEIGEGTHPERSTQIARTALGNFMIAAAKGVQNGFGPETVADGVKDGIKDGHKTIAKWGYVGGAMAVGIAACTAAPALLSFFIANHALLYQFSMVAGCELSWLPSFLNWLEKQRARFNV